jgi:hypothetical protein
MPPNKAFFQLAGWSAMFNAAAGIAGFATLMIFFAAGGLWGPLNDAVSVLWALSLLPLAWLFYQLHRPISPPTSAAAAVLGIVAMVSFASLQGLLVLGAVSFDQTVRAVLALNGVIGLWLMINGWLAWAGRCLPASLVAAMFACGLALVAINVGYGLGGQEHPLTAAGFLIGVVAGTAWALGLGRLLLNGRVVTQLDY